MKKKPMKKSSKRKLGKTVSKPVEPPLTPYETQLHQYMKLTVGAVSPVRL